MTIGSQKSVETNELPEHFRWRLEDIYENTERLDEDINRLYKLSSILNEYSGRLQESAKNIYECLMLRDTIYRILDKLYLYSHLKRDDDNYNTKNQELVDRIEGVCSQIDKICSFIHTEIMNISDERLEEFYTQNEKLELYRHHIDEIKRAKCHTLNHDSESIISAVSDAISFPENIYKVLCNVDMAFPQIKCQDGTTYELSEGCYNQLIRSSDRGLRKKAFFSLYDTYYKYGNTFAALLNSNVKKDEFTSKIRNFGSSFEATLFEDNIPYYVYQNVFEHVNNSIHINHEYISTKKKLLGIDDIHFYDLYAPVIDDRPIFIPYEEGIHIIEKSLEPLGQNYISLLSRGFNSRWIDVFSRRGKSSGAYSWGLYDTHPYILMNYCGSLEDISVLSHEMGHSIHSYLTAKSQPYVYSHYSLFTAEVASSLNEVLLLYYLYNTAKNKNTKIIVMSQILDKISTTVYRQTMLTEFDCLVHQKCENGECLSLDFLCSLWIELNSKYYGPGIIVDEIIGIEWARIAHFYWNFYAYRYAAGFAVALTLAEKIIKSDASAVEKYINLLKSGDSDYPIDLLRKAGVDIEKIDPITDTLSIFEKILIKFKKLIA